MPRLIVLNGPPGVGKSTLARRYAADHPPALDLDLDRIELLVGGHENGTLESKVITRDLAAGMADTHLRAGHDVIVPHYLGRPLFLERLEALAAEVGADFHEIILLDSLQRLERRFAHRSATSTEPEHLAAARVIEAEGPAYLAQMREQLVELVTNRPRAVVLECPEGQEDVTYRALLQTVRGASV